MPSTLGDPLFIGAQVGYWRKRRGRSRRALAGLAGMSQGYVSKIESGRVPVERRATLVALAEALEVTVAELTGQSGDAAVPHAPAAVSHVPAIREALARREVGETLEVHQDAGAAIRAGEAYDFAALIPALPDLLGGLRGTDLIPLAHVASYALKDLGYPDLGREAARLALDEAYQIESVEWIGVAELIRIMAMPPETPQAPAARAGQIADELQPKTGNPQVRQVYGMLHLTAGLRCAVARRREAALDHLAEAREAADSLGEPSGLGIGRFAFGPTNVGFWTVAIHLELGEPAVALKAASRLVAPLVPLANRQGPYYADVATALAQTGRDREAIAAFLRSEAVGPQWFRLRPTVRETIGSIIRRTRRPRSRSGCGRSPSPPVSGISRTTDSRKESSAARRALRFQA